MHKMYAWMKIAAQVGEEVRQEDADGIAQAEVQVTGDGEAKTYLTARDASGNQRKRRFASFIGDRRKYTVIALSGRFEGAGHALGS